MAKNHRLFKYLIKEMGTPYVGFCFMPKSVDCQVANASIGCMNLKMKLKSFFEKNKNNLHVQFHNKEFVMMLAHLADAFDLLNDMNLFFQSRDVTFSDDKDKLAGLTALTGVWQARIKVGSTSSFPLLETRLKMNKIDLAYNIKT